MIWRVLRPRPCKETPPEYVDWFAAERIEGRDIDVGMHRHWVDPTIPLARDVLAPAHGALITSATLRDISVDADDWASAEIRTGAGHLPQPAKRSSFGSPFRYGEQARHIIEKRLGLWVTLAAAGIVIGIVIALYLI